MLVCVAVDRRAGTVTYESPDTSRVAFVLALVGVLRGYGLPSKLGDGVSEEEWFFTKGDRDERQ